MLIVRLRNLLLHWPDPVPGARLYADPARPAQPDVGKDSDADAITDANGEARLPVDSLTPGEHTLCIVPRGATTDPVGYWTATGPDVARIFFAMLIQFTVGPRKNIQAATAHASTANNGTLTVPVPRGNDQVLDV